MVSITSLPGMKEGSTIRNTLIGVLYVFIIMVAAVSVGEELLLFSPFIVAVAVWKNVRGTAEAASAVPGVSPDGGLKSGAAAFGIMFLAVFVVYAAVLPGGADQQSAGTNDTMTDQQPDDAQAETAAATETRNTQAEKTTTESTTATPQQQSPDGEATKTPTETATPTPTPTPTPTEEPETGFQIRISYDGEWSGTIGTLGNSRSVDGSGTETFDIKESNPDTVSTNAQKQDDSSGTLTVQILKNGDVVKESTTSAEYGIAQTTYSNW